MTFEEMQQVIQSMLTVQRELQESQLKLLEQSKLTERKLDRLISYNIDQETELSIMQDEVVSLKRRVDALERQS